MTLSQKYQALRDSIAAYESALVCFSGGVDSTLLLRVAHDVLGDRCTALIALSATMAQSEQRAALDLARGMGVRCEIVESHELSRPEFQTNPKDRCYHCKSELLDIAAPVAERLGCKAILLGTNVDDLGDYRPGLQAAKDRGAAHPLLDAGLNKQEIRELSKELGLSTWDKPQLACLSSRFPYGTTITTERLHQVDAFEEGLRALGFRQLRVRFHNEVARVEVEPDAMPRALELRETIVKLGRKLGFTFVSLDLAGFASGSLNQLIGIRPRASASK
jgi:uncharacterized protein